MDGGGDVPKHNLEVVPGLEESIARGIDGGVRLSQLGAESSKHDIGIAGIRSMDLPDSWSQTREVYQTRGDRMTFTPAGQGDLALTVINKGRSLNDTQLANFDAVLATADQSGRPKVLLPSQIRSITDALDKTTVGDNQYVNSARPPDPTSPVFKVTSAQVITVDGRPVVEIEGQFLDENGQRIKDYIGMFGKIEGNKVGQVFVQSSSKDEFIRGRKVYKDALSSLDWR